MPHNTDPEKRFWSRVFKGEPDDCWIFSGHRAGRNNYSQIRVNGARWQPHRYSYFLAHGSIDDTLLCCHSCDTPRCVNPRHLFMGTQTENMQDMVAKGRHWRQRRTQDAERAANL